MLPPFGAIGERAGSSFTPIVSLKSRHLSEVCNFQKIGYDSAVNLETGKSDDVRITNSVMSWIMRLMIRKTDDIRWIFPRNKLLEDLKLERTFEKMNSVIEEDYALYIPLN